MSGQRLSMHRSGYPCCHRQGGGPFTFDCDGPQTVVTEALIVIDNDVILDGGGNLTVDGNDDHGVFSVDMEVNAGLTGLSIARGRGPAALRNSGTVALTAVTVSDSACRVRDCFAGGIENGGTMSLTDSTVSGNSADIGDGIFNIGDLSIANSTVSGNTRTGNGSIRPVIVNSGTTGLIQSTIEGDVIVNFPDEEAALTVSRSLIVGSCLCFPEPCAPVSNGFSIESPGNTCGFDTNLGDQFDVTAEALALGPLQDNGGPTMTHALGAGSVAIDQILEADCVDADGVPLTTDQRGQPRPETGGTMCDVGAFEVQP